MAKVDRRTLGRENEVVIARLPEATRQRTWDVERKHIMKVPNQEDSDPCSDCHVYQGSSQNGYPSKSQGHAKSKIKIKIHILAAWSKCKTLPDSGEVVSHLCHRKMCISPDHLVIESIQSNNRRKGCLKALTEPESARIWNLCPHMPKCLRPDKDTIGSFVPTVIFDPAWS